MAPGLDGIPTKILLHKSDKNIRDWLGTPLTKDWVDEILILLVKSKISQSV